MENLVTLGRAKEEGERFSVEGCKPIKLGSTALTCTRLKTPHTEEHLPDHFLLRNFE